MVYRWKRCLCSGNMDNFKFNISCLCYNSYKLNFYSIRIEVMKNLGSILKSRDITLLTKVHPVKAIFIQCSVLSSVTQSRLTLCNTMDCSTPGFPVLHNLLQFAQTHVHWMGDAIQASHPVSFPSPVFNLCQHLGLFQWGSSSHQVAKVSEFQLQHQSFQWIFRVYFLYDWLV